MRTPRRYGDAYKYMEAARGGYGPVIITCALNGGIQGREAHPALPETPEQIAEQAQVAYEAGASIVHIHGRDPDRLWAAARTPDVYEEINALVRERCPDVIINNTTGGGPTTTMDERIDCLRAAPEMASLNLGPDMSRFVIKPRRPPLPHPHDGMEIDDCVPFTYGVIRRLAGEMKDRGIKPELEIYQPGQFWVSRDLADAGLLEAPPVHQFVMGAMTGAFPTPMELLHLVELLPDDAIFFACGIGPFQVPIITQSMLLGGHARVGLEDNLYAARGEKWRDNGEAVGRAAAIATDVGRGVATPAQARELLGLPESPRTYTAVAAGT
jgi:3-keto-5-aminohexanoate cleavage enzyme